MPSIPRRHLRHFLALAISLCVVATAVVASADTREDLDAAEARLSDLRDQISSEQAALSELQGELNRLAGQIESASSKVEGTRQEIKVVEKDLADAERDFEATQDRLSERAAEAFMDGPGTQFDFLLGSGSMADLSDRIEYLGVVQKNDGDLSNEFLNLQNELGFARERLGDLLATQQGALDALEAAQADMEQRFSEQQASLDRISGLRSEAEALVERLEKKLDAELSRYPRDPNWGRREWRWHPRPAACMPCARSARVCRHFRRHPQPSRLDARS